MKNRIISYFILLLLCFPATALLQQNVSSITRKQDRNYRLARQYEAVGKYDEALQIYRRLWEDDLRNITYYRGVKNNLLLLKQFSEAVKTTEQMLTIKKNFYIEADLGDIYYKLGNKEKALKIWNDIIGRNKTKPGVYQAVANSMISNRLLEDAIKVYKRGRKNSSNKSLFLVEIANLYNSRLDYKNATLMYLEYLKYMPNQFSFVEGRLAKLAKNIEEAEPIIKIIAAEIENKNGSIFLRRLLAGLYIQDSNYRQALEAYKFIDKNADYKSSKNKEIWGKELLNFARNAFNDGAYEYSEQAFKILILRYPDSPLVPRAQLGLAEATYRQQEYAVAIEEYQKIITSYPRYEEAKRSYLQIGEIKLNHFHNPNAAKEAFNTILKKFPFSNDHFEAMFKIGECEIYLGELEKAGKWYQNTAASKRATDAIKERAYYKLALIDFWQGNFDAVQKRLEQITKIQPVFRRKDKTGFYVNDALELSIFIDENKQESEVLKEYAKCMFLLNQNSYDDALFKLNELLVKNPQSQLADDILLRISEIEIELIHFQEAINAYRLLISSYPKSISCDFAQKRIGEIYETKLGDIGLAMKEYELVLSNYPESLLLEEVRKKIRELEKTSVR